MASYDLSKKAAEDLYDIWIFTYAIWSERQADRYYAILKQAFEDIASYPMSVGKECDALVQGLRSYHIRRHIIFYTLQANGRTLIVRILHERMDYARHL